MHTLLARAQEPSGGEVTRGEDRSEQRASRLATHRLSRLPEKAGRWLAVDWAAEALRRDWPGLMCGAEG